MASQLERTSAILGEYMLKGWTLTDLHCDRCRTTPLMREPLAQAQREGRAAVQFCALCDGGPSALGSGAASSSTTISVPAIPGAVLASASASTAPSGSGSASARPPAPAPAPAPAPDPAESISALLLAGYSLLGENCPNASCRGIPLVGFPRPAGEGRGKDRPKRDGRKMCVSCGARWAGEGAVRSGEGGLRAMYGVPSGARAVGQGEDERERRRREMYGLSGPTEVAAGGSEQAKRDAEAAAARAAISAADMEDETDDYDSSDEYAGLGASSPAQARAAPPPTTTTTTAAEPSRFLATAAAEPTPLAHALGSASAALTSALARLATSLESHTGGTGRSGQSGPERYFVDLKLHTEAMRDVLEVLGRVRGAQAQEGR